MSGYRKTSNEFPRWRYAKKPEEICLYMHLLHMAAWEPTEVDGVHLEEGQIKTSSRDLESRTGLTKKRIERMLKDFNGYELTIHERTARHSLFSIHSIKDAIEKRTPSGQNLPKNGDTEKLENHSYYNGVEISDSKKGTLRGHKRGHSIHQKGDTESSDLFSDNNTLSDGPIKKGDTDFAEKGTQKGTHIYI